MKQVLALSQSDRAVTFVMHSQLHVDCAICCAYLLWAQHACQIQKLMQQNFPQLSAELWQVTIACMYAA